MHEREEVSGGLVVPGGDPPVRFEGGPEPLDPVPVLVPVGVDGPLDLPGLQGRDHGLPALGLDRVHQGLLVVPLVPDHDGRGEPVERGLGVGDIGVLAGAQGQPHGHPNPLTAAWILVPNPPRLRPRSWSS